jgi:uncharacterized membrane protein
MELSDFREVWLTLHILGAIGAFGFGFTAPIFASAAAREPQHGPWYLRAVKRVSDVVIVPLALSMVVTGFLLVYSIGDHRLFEQLWLSLSFVIYVVAILAVFLVQRPALKKVIELTAQPPGPDGPPAEVPALLDRLKYIGIGLTVAVIVIVYLMVAKPVL